jgi:hypothetical protein
LSQAKTDQGTFVNENNLKDKMKDLFPSNLKNEKYFEDEFFNAYFLLEKPLFKIRKIKRDQFEILESFDTKLLEEYNSTKLSFHDSDFITNTKINLDICSNNHVKVKDCRKLETLEVDKEYFITDVSNILFRNKTRYIINLQNEGVFISNESCKSELEKVFINSGKNVKHKIKEHLNEKILLLRTVDFYTNSQNKKEILVNITAIKTNYEGLRCSI